MDRATRPLTRRQHWRERGGEVGVSREILARARPLAPRDQGLELEQAMLGGGWGGILGVVDFPIP